MKKSLLIVIPLIFILLLTCCTAPKDENSIVGKWELEEGTSTKGLRIPREIEFFSDGSLQSNCGGKYVIEDGRLNIYYSAMDSYSYIFEVQDDLLILQSNDNNTSDTSDYRYFKSDVIKEDDFEGFGSVDKTDEKQLASSCDYILAEGVNKNGDTYQLVANESESYDSKSEIGVIKNNEWLIELSSNSPFIDENGKIIYFDTYLRQFEYPESDDLYGYSKTYRFINNCCFMAGEYNGGTFGSYDFIWNVETNSNYNINNGRFIIEKDDTLVGINDENIIFYDYYDYNNWYKILNTKTMSITKEFAENEFYNIYPISEGVFYALKDKDGNDGFYDLNCKQVIDMRKYHNSGGCYFVDDRCTFTATNSSGKAFEITIDKSGNVISEKPVE